MGEITGADPGDHPGAAVGLRAGGLHPRHLRPAVPAVRGGGVGVDGDLGNQRPDPVARALRHPAAAAPRAKRGPIGLVSRRIDCARDGYVAVVARLCASAVFGLLLLAVAFGAVAGCSGSCRRLPAVRGPGRVLRRGAAARGRFGQPHRRWASGSRSCSRHRGVAHSRWSATACSTG